MFFLNWYRIQFEPDESNQESPPKNPATIMLDIVNTFKKNKVAKSNNKGRSSVIQFLIDNNFKQETLDKEKFDSIENEKRSPLHKQMTANLDNNFNQVNDLESPSRRRAATKHKK